MNRKKLAADPSHKNLCAKLKIQPCWLKKSFLWTLLLGVIIVFMPTQKAICANIIFDLNGVLINTNYQNALEQLKLTKTDFIWYFISHGKSPRTTLYKILETIKPRRPDELPAGDDQGNLLPQLLIDWQRGLYAGTEIRDFLLYYCQAYPEIFSSALEEKIITRTIKSMFTPEKFAAMQEWLPEGIALLNLYKEKGHHLYVLSNWDTATFDCMYANQKFKKIFDLFDGIVISGDAHLIKPDPAIYHLLLDKFDLDAKNCIFIDDQLVNTQAAESVGIHSVWCRPARSFFRPWETYPDLATVQTELAAIETSLAKTANI